jgi:ribosomal protein S12 methylthiotransferase accessory factor
MFGEPQIALATFWAGTPVQKAFAGGTQRVVSPEQTLERVRPFFTDFGITRVANLTGLDTLGIPVCAAFRPNARSLAVSQGKGVDLAAARASAVMEAIEAFHAESIPAALKLGSMAELGASLNLVDCARLARTSSASFGSTSRILWIEGKSLCDGVEVWVPFELVNLNFTLPALTGSGYFVASSNGLASGNHVLEAISHALCEVIERDAVTLWALFGEEYANRRRLDLQTIDDAEVLALLKQFEEGGVAVAVWDITSSVGVPAFSSAIIDRSPNPLHPLPHARGMGCHPSRRIAMLRALTEAAQSRLTVIAGSRDDLKQTRYRDLLDPDGQERTRRMIVDSVGVCDYRAVPTYESETFDGDIHWLLTRLRSVGLDEAIVVDLTRSEFKIPVVRVIVPGLEAMYDMPGYSPGERAKALVLRRAS